MPSKNQNCLGCYFFYQTSEKQNSSEALVRIGYCRANPPTPFFEKDEDGQTVPRIARFPVVLGHMWCGAFDYCDKKEAVA